MPQASEPRLALAGGSTPTTMRPKSAAAAAPTRLEQCALPQRVGALLDDLAVELLPAERVSP